MSVNIYKDGSLEKVAGNYIVDDEMSLSSENPIQNKIVTKGINDLDTNKQNITDNTLETTAKTIPGAINELNSNLTSIWTTNGLGNVDTIGNYIKWFNGYDSGTTGTLPFTNDHFLLVSTCNTGKNICIQVAIPLLNSGIKKRFYQGNAWGEWLS